MIGIFDSGLGGLTVAKAVMKKLPEYQIMYLGDTARTPYGNRSPQTIYQFTVEAIDFLFSHGCELIIVACNTVSAEALRRIQQEYLPKYYSQKRVLGVIRPLVEHAAKVTKTNRIGVVGTRGTINSNAYERELVTQNSEIKVFQQACPLLVPLVEEGWMQRPETMKIIRFYVRSLKQQQIDTLILGCTHYPFLLKQFKAAVGKKIYVIDGPSVIAEKLYQYLVRHPEIEKNLAKNKNHKFFVTDKTEQFQNNAEMWLKNKIKIEEISL